MWGFLISMFIVWIILNLIGTLMIFIEYEDRIPDLIEKRKYEGLSLIDVILIGISPIAHGIAFIKYIVVDANDGNIHNFFHKNRFFKPKGNV
jgi:hypothetical protein